MSKSGNAELEALLRRLERQMLTRDTVLPLSRAPWFMGVRTSTGLAEIERAGIIRRVAGKRVCVWGEVLDHVLVREVEGASPTPRPQRRLKKAKL